MAGTHQPRTDPEVAVSLPLVTIGAGNGANSGRTARLVAVEVATFDIGDGETVDAHIGVVDVDGIPRRYAMGSLHAVAG